MHTTVKISLRPAVPEDLSGILHLFRTAIYTACSADYTAEQLTAWASSSYDLARWEAHLLNPDLLIAVDGDAIVGFAALKAPAHIDLMYVHPGYLRKGVGGILMRALLAKTTGPVTADVSRTARPFFERQGFVVVKEMYPVRNGVVIPNFRMCKAG